MHVTIPEPEHPAVVLSDKAVDLLLGDDVIARWAWDAAGRFTVSPRRAVRLLASAIAGFGQAVGCPREPTVDVGSCCWLPRTLAGGLVEPTRTGAGGGGARG
jgi:hypothetical protein